MKNKKAHESFVQFFDAIFIMLLCFITLLGTMLMRGAVIVGSNSGDAIHYSFNIATFGIVAVCLAIYLLFILPQSNRELKLMVKEMYDIGEKSR